MPLLRERLAAGDHPRSRGEYLKTCWGLRVGGGSSPLSRGILSAKIRSIREIRIIPALAGNTIGWTAIGPRAGDHPRSRGEYPTNGASDPPPPGSSPLSRGIPGQEEVPPQGVGIIPALAGNTLTRALPIAPRPDHPRSRGEYRRSSTRLSDKYGSSPLSRGIPYTKPLSGFSGRIIPALAGNTLVTGHLCALRRDHPRSRGEYLWCTMITAQS